MEKAPSGYYRQLLSDKKIRIAFTHTPMSGVTRVDKSPIIEELKKSDDRYAQYYINGLENGDMVTIVENDYIDTYYRTGELYFKS